MCQGEKVMGIQLINNAWFDQWGKLTKACCFPGKKIILKHGRNECDLIFRKWRWGVMAVKVWCEVLPEWCSKYFMKIWCILLFKQIMSSTNACRQWEITIITFLKNSWRHFLCRCITSPNVNLHQWVTTY